MVHGRAEDVASGGMGLPLMMVHTRPSAKLAKGDSPAPPAQV